MNIQLNNRPETFDENKLTVSELLEIKNFTFKLLVIKINGVLVKKDNYDITNIIDGDAVSVLHMISGG